MIGPWEIFGFGIGAKIDITTLWHIVIYSGGFCLAVPFFEWRMRRTKEKRVGTMGFSPAVFISVRNAAIIASFWALAGMLFGVEFEQGLDARLRIVPDEAKSFFDVFDCGIPIWLNAMLRKFVFKLKD